jgi:hypothetical protein
MQIRAKGISVSVEDALFENSWLRLALIFAVAPMLWLLLAFFWGHQVVAGWLVVTAAYCVALLIGTHAESTGSMESRGRLEVSRILVARLSPLFWGGILATPVYFLFMFIFDGGDFFQR